MDRLSKKCVIASGVVHGTLVLLLLVGPAFLPSDSAPTSAEILTIIPDIAIPSGAPVIGFGTPNGGRQDPTPPPPRPPEPKPPAPEPPKPVAVRDTPKDEPRKTDDDIKTAERKPTPDPDSLETTPKRRKPVVDVSKPVVRNSSKSPSKDTAAADKAKAAAAAKQAAKRFESAMQNIRSGSSSGVEVGPVGVSTGSGPSVAAFGDILRTIYFNNWREPSGATADDAVVKVTVTIARDGSVISARITRSSGDSAVDRSVQHTLDTVTFITPFPADWKESQRQFQISFSLKAKRSIG